MKYFKLIIIIVVYIQISCINKNKQLIIFFAAFFTPIYNELKDEAVNDLGINFITESGGSQMLCRKITDLNRECDLAILAESSLFEKLLHREVKWKIDFACDEIVLGVGIRAKKIDQVEKDWVSIIKDENIVLGRVNENTGPIGFRTLQVWKLKEFQGYPDLYNILKNKCVKIMDDAENLASILKTGDIDYAFLYKTSCIEHDIRYITLDSSINLGDISKDYSNAKIVIKKIKNGKAELMEIKGSPIVYSLSILQNAPNRDNAIAFIKYFLNNKKHLSNLGFKQINPVFYGDQDDYKIFISDADYAGNF